MLINCDLKFSVKQRDDKPPLRYVISGDAIRGSKLKAVQFVDSILNQKGFEKHMEKLAVNLKKQDPDTYKNITAGSLLDKLKRELLIKVIWVRFVTDKENLKQAMRAFFQSAYLLETHGEGC